MQEQREMKNYKEAHLDQIEFKDKTRSGREKLLIVVVVLFFLIAAVFAGLFIYYYLEYEDSNDDEPCVAKDSAGADVIDGELCVTRGCVEAVADVLKRANLTADPCEDFYEFACGRWSRDAVIPDGMTRIDNAVINNMAAQRHINTIITEELQTDDSPSLKSLKNFYKSCLDQAAIEKEGTAAYLSAHQASWPTLNTFWSSSGFSLENSLLRYQLDITLGRQYPELEASARNPLFGIQLIPDETKSAKKLFIKVTTGDFFVIGSQRAAFEKYYKTLAVSLGAGDTVAAEDAKAVCDFYINMTEIMVKNRQNTTDQTTTLGQLRTRYTSLYVATVIEAFFADANVTLPDDEIVLNPYDNFLTELEQLVTATDNRVLQNVLAYSQAQQISDLTKQLADNLHTYEKARYMTSKPKPRKDYCKEKVLIFFDEELSKEYIERHFDEETKTVIENLLADLKLAFKEILQENSWMTPATKERAIEKLDAMRYAVGFAPNAYNNTDKNALTMDPTKFYLNSVKLLQRQRRYIATFLHTLWTFDNKWAYSPYVVNAFSWSTENAIGVLTGIMLLPFGPRKEPSAMLYGGFGYIVGHELTHGFDNGGRNFDKTGALNDWWEPKDSEKYNDKAQCLVEQYGNFRVHEVNKTVNGARTLGENIADNGGLKEAYRAYKNTDDATPHLPVLGLTNDQLFFLAFAQNYCRRMDVDALRTSLWSDVHTVANFRVIGPLQNSKEFSKAYECKSGTPMNPVKKCSVW